MTSPTALRRYANTWLTPELQTRGFTLIGKRLQYVRTKGDIYHLLSAQIFRGGDAMRLWVFPWVPEGQAPYDMDRFPEGVGVYAGGELGERSIGIGGKSWPIGTEAQAQESFRDIVRLLDKVGIPFLDKIVTRAALAAAVSPGERIAAGGILRSDLILGNAKPYSEAST